jgi:hypothetical protein
MMSFSPWSVAPRKPCFFAEAVSGAVAEYVEMQRMIEVGQVEVAAAGDAVGEKVAALEFQRGEHAVLQAHVEVLVGVALDGKVGIPEELEADDVARVFEVDENADLLTGFWLERALDEVVEAEGRIRARGDLLGNGHGWKRGFARRRAAILHRSGGHASW